MYGAEKGVREKERKSQDQNVGDPVFFGIFGVEQSCIHIMHTENSLFNYTEVSKFGVVCCVWYVNLV